MQKFTPLFKTEAMVSQPFGETVYARTNPNYARNSLGVRYHEGIDLYPKGRKDFTLFTPFFGEVMWVGEGPIYGRSLIIWDELSRMSYRFCHMEVILVKKGRKVTRGDKIGAAGDTGASAGIHLHLNAVPMAVWGTKLCPWNGHGGRVDPLGLLVQAGVHV